MDFTISTYRNLINTLQQQGFSFLTFEKFVSHPEDKVVVLRHDVDLLPKNSLRFAQIQADMGIRGTYYFRIVTESFDEKIIKEISSMGHEIGYHYEDVSIAAKRRQASGDRQQEERHNGSIYQPFNSSTDEEELVKIAIARFRENLAKLRELVPVKTICMHGSPISKWDSRLLWKYYDYHDFGLIGEPYFDIDFDEVLYLTDTGRCWDGDMFSIRDKVVGSSFAKASEDKGWDEDSFNIRDSAQSSELRAQGTTSSKALAVKAVPRAQGKSNRLPITDHRSPFPKFHSTFDIIKAAESGKLPDKIMMTFHPQRWTDRPVPWMKELVWQNVKNIGKYFLIIVSSE